MKSKKSKWPKIIIILAVVAILVLIVVQATKSKAVSLTEATAQNGTLTTYYSFTGTLAAMRTQNAVAPENGVIDQIYVLAGDQVKKNDRLLKLTSGTVLRADFAGEVTDIAVHPDDQVAAGTLLLTVADLSSLEAKIKVDEYDIAALHVGDLVTLNIPAVNQTAQGTVSAINKLATETPTATYYTVTVSLSADDSMLPGMEAGIKVLKNHAENAVLLKMDALKFDEDNAPYVLTKDHNNRLTTTPVTVGINDGTTVEIKSGLAAGTTVYYTDNSFQDIYDMMMRGRSGK